MIWILGGTHEVKDLLNLMKDYSNIIVSVTTEEAREFLPIDLKVHVGKMTEEEKLELVHANDIDFIVDMTHPFSKHIKKSIDEFSKKYHIPLVRFKREIEKIESKNIIYADGYDEAERLIKNLHGTFFFTTGVNESERFYRVRGENRMIFRVLPSVKSVQKLADIGVNMKDICAMLGPFSVEMNVALIKNFGADYIVTKNSGDGSGIMEKIEAAKVTNIKIIVIEPDEVPGIKDLDVLRQILEEKNEFVRRDTKKY